MAEQLALGEAIADHRPDPVGFSCVLADPPWWESGGGGRGAQNHYPLMRTADIARLPVADVVARNAHLWLWVTDNFLTDGLEVMGAWGFRYKRTFCWGKVKDGRVQTGLGQYGRGAHELCLLGVRGKLPIPPERRPPSLWLAPRTKHSAKPAVSYGHIERASPNARLELFARAERPGWVTAGHGVGDEPGDVLDDLVAMKLNREFLAEVTAISGEV